MFYVGRPSLPDGTGAKYGESVFDQDFFQRIPVDLFDDSRVLESQNPRKRDMEPRNQ